MHRLVSVMMALSLLLGTLEKLPPSLRKLQGQMLLIQTPEALGGLGGPDSWFIGQYRPLFPDI